MDEMVPSVLVTSDSLTALCCVLMFPRPGRSCGRVTSPPTSSPSLSDAPSLRVVCVGVGPWGVGVCVCVWGHIGGAFLTPVHIH